MTIAITVKVETFHAEELAKDVIASIIDAITDRNNLADIIMSDMESEIRNTDLFDYLSLPVQDKIMPHCKLALAEWCKSEFNEWLKKEFN